MSASLSAKAISRFPRIIALAAPNLDLSMVKRPIIVEVEGDDSIRAYGQYDGKRVAIVTRLSDSHGAIFARDPKDRIIAYSCNYGTLVNDLGKLIIDDDMKANRRLVSSSDHGYKHDDNNLRRLGL